MRKRGVPENHVQVLLRALHLDTIKEQEQALIQKSPWKKPSTMKKVREIATSLSDEIHAEQDRKLALVIFDKTKQLNSLGAEERHWLESAALLHDIGVSRSRKGHHKLSLRLILNDPTLPFTSKERYIIGSIARYHRGALPNKKHFNLKPLSRTERDKVAVLSAILRAADALDYSHRSIVKKLTVRILPDEVVFECQASGSHYLEDRSVSKKKDLFEKVFKRDLAIIWRTNSRRTHGRMLVGAGSVAHNPTAKDQSTV
jgi:exopolyphosphatase/guanosine-5'-triphosphate,3'-diphosphate pyrophosphatase